MKYGLTEETYNKIKNVIDKYSNYKFKIFGSRERGDFKPYSDIDIVVEECIKEQEKFKIKNEFDMLNIPYTIDLLFLEEICKEDFLNKISKEAISFE